MINTITCKVCGGNFHLVDENHYIARDSKIANGFAQALSGEEEPKQYDAFDCPFCGCQYIAQERKRLLEISEPMGDEPEEGSCEECEYLEKTKMLNHALRVTTITGFGITLSGGQRNE